MMGQHKRIRRYIFRAFVGGALVLPVAAGCGSGSLPHEHGVGWICHYVVKRNGMEVGSNFDSPITICADPNVSPSDVESHCEDKADARWCQYGSWAAKFNFIGVCNNATVLSVDQTGAPCPPGSDAAGPAREKVDLDMNATVTIDGDSASTHLTGKLWHTISSQCTGTTCPFEIVSLNLSSSQFKIKGHTVRANITGNNPAMGTWHSDTHNYELPPPDALGVTVEFFIDGDEGSTALTSGMSSVVGTADPDGNNFGIHGTFSNKDNTVTVDLNGTYINRPPVPVIKPDAPVECNGPNSASVTLDGTLSHDPENNIKSYAWYLGNPPNQTLLGNLSQEPAVLSLGPNTVQLDLIDELDSISNDRKNIQVVDTTPPTIDTLTVAPPCVWPPNHDFVLYQLGAGLSAHATDICDPSPIPIDVVGVTSNQPASGGGQGTAGPDTLFGKKAFCIRAERQGTSKSPRVYTVTVQATDASGNASQRSVVIRVAHDQSGTKCQNIPKSRVVSADDPRCTAD